MHPLARTNNQSGTMNLRSGDRVRHILDGRIGVADEFTQDGDALMTWSDGSFGIVRSTHLSRFSTT